MDKKFDLAEQFNDIGQELDFRFVEARVEEGLSDNEIIAEYKIYDAEWTEESLRFVKWVLYYFRLIGKREGFLEEEFVDDDFIENHPSHTESESKSSGDEAEEGKTELDEETLEEKAETIRRVIREHASDLFQEAELEEESDEDDREVLAIEAPDEGKGDYMCFDVSIKTGASPTCEEPEVWPSNSVTYYLRNKHFIYINITFVDHTRCPNDVEVTIQNKRCHTIINSLLTAELIKESDGSIIYPINGDELIPNVGPLVDSIEFCVRDKVTGEVLHEESKCLLCGDTLFDFLHIDRIVFFPSARNVNPLNCDFHTGYTAFARKGLEQVNVICQISSKVGIDLGKHNFYYYLYDETGRIVTFFYANVVKDSNSGQSLVYGSFQESLGRPLEWKDGLYKVELQSLNKSVISTSFRVGSSALEGEVDVPQIVSMLKNAEVAQMRSANDALRRLDEMVGLKSVKEKIYSLSNLSTLALKRKEFGLPIKGVSLHARFVGNPGTGKTTIAEIIGQIYKELGLLSSGHVVRVERKNLVGRYYDSELRAIEQSIESARGGVLLIEEAYNLYVPDDPRDPGKRVLEALLTALSDEKQRDWMLVLSGYPDEIDNMLNANPGIKSLVNEVFYFDDFTVEELMQIADLYCQQNSFKMSSEVRKHLEAVVARDYGARDKNFGNARYIYNLMEQTIAANMAHRISRIEAPTIEQLQTIEVEDIPSIRKIKQSRGLDGLNEMVGLDSLKNSISRHLNMVKLANMRIKMGLDTTMPPLHMVFTGNPGTGKTTVADFLGEIYASMGLLSKGDVLRVEKRDLVGSHVGETEQKMKAILSRARGNILFIDEAYQLYTADGQNDYGKVVMESLLTTLSADKIDMIVILAGYPKDMERLLQMNEGLSSRFPYTFHFEDYSAEELHKIALQCVKRDNYTLTRRAEQLLLLLIKREVLRKRSSFGNARFVTRLLSAEILPRMATRLDKISEPTMKQLKTIVAEDIPITAQEADRIEKGGFDNKAIDVALAKLDTLVGQNKVKKAIHNFVDVARYLNSQGEQFVGKGLLKWSFAGNSGTGKSTIAAILADILKAMNLLDKGNIVEVKGEEIFNVSEYQCDQVLRQAMERSRYGMLFIDGDAPEFRNTNEYRMTGEQLRIKLSSLTAEMGGQGALVIAECNSPRQTVANSLAINGIYDFDHTFFFDDYTPDELFEILCRRLAKHKVKFSAEAEEKMRSYINALCSNRSLSFANARTMKHLARTIYEQVILREIDDKSSPRKVVLLSDVDNYTWIHRKQLGY